MIIFHIMSYTRDPSALNCFIQSLHREKSPTYILDNFKLLAERHNKCFNILSTNIESINAKHSEIEAFMEELNLINFKFSLICFQECWLSENDEMCHLQLEGYQCIKQGKTCSNKGGLVMYLSKTFNYKLILSLNQFDNWEGQFIKVTGGGLSKDIIIGNIYRPPRDLNENYKGSHWLIESPTIFSSICSPPLSDMSIIFFNIFTLLALTQSFGSLFHLFITLCEKEYFLMYFLNLHCSLTNAALCLTAFFKFEEHIPINILITVHYFKHFYLVSS